MQTFSQYSGIALLPLVACITQQSDIKEGGWNCDNGSHSNDGEEDGVGHKQGNKEGEAGDDLGLRTVALLPTAAAKAVTAMAVVMVAAEAVIVTAVVTATVTVADDASTT